MKRRNVMLIMVVALLLYAGYWRLYPFESLPSVTDPKYLMSGGNDPLETNPYSPPGVQFAFPELDHAATASWAKREPYPIKRPVVPPGPRPLTPALINWAHARVDAFVEGHGDEQTYGQGIAILREAGYNVVADWDRPIKPEWVEPAFIKLEDDPYHNLGTL